MTRPSVFVPTLSAVGLAVIFIPAIPFTPQIAAVVCQILAVFLAAWMMHSVRRFRPKYAISWWFGAVVVLLAGSLPTFKVVDSAIGANGVLLSAVNGSMGLLALSVFVMWIRSKKSRWELPAILDTVILLATIFVIVWEVSLRLQTGNSADAQARVVGTINVMLSSGCTIFGFYILRSATAGFVPAFRYFLVMQILAIASAVLLVVFPDAWWIERLDPIQRLLSLTLAAAMASHPSMIHFTEPAPPVRSAFGKRQLLLLAFALVTPVMTVGLSALHSTNPDLRVWIPLTVLSLVCVALRVGTIMAERDQEQRKVQQYASQREALAIYSREALGTRDVDDVIKGALRLLSDNVSVKTARVWDCSTPTELRLKAQHVSEPSAELDAHAAILTTSSSIEAIALQQNGTLVADDEFAVLIGIEGRKFGILSGISSSISESEAFFIEQVALVLAMAMARSNDEQDHRQAQRMEAVGRLSSGLAHEINTPLQAMSSNLDFLTGSFSSLISQDETFDKEFLEEETPAALNDLKNGLERVSRVVAAMRAFGDIESQRELVDINDAIAKTVAIVNHELQDIDLRIDAANIPPLLCDSAEMNQVFLGVLMNAIDAVHNVEDDRDKIITIRTWMEGESITIAVKDSGRGIDDAIRERIWDPFFTTKDVGSGTGQGLTLARAVVKAHRGDIRFETSQSGTEFIIVLPVDNYAEESRTERDLEAVSL